MRTMDVRKDVWMFVVIMITVVAVALIADDTWPVAPRSPFNPVERL
jgi:hypothetical protein